MTKNALTYGEALEIVVKRYARENRLLTPEPNFDEIPLFQPSEIN